MKILLVNPRGFCAGVNRALNIVYSALKIFGSPIYVFHKIVHNDYIVKYFLKIGVIFVNNISSVPDQSVLIFSAHGVSKKIKEEASFRNFRAVFDATCPLVSKVQMEVSRASDRFSEVILIGHNGHPEIEGVIGHYNSDGKKKIHLISNEKDVWKLKIMNQKNLCYVTQTTLSIYETDNIIRSLYVRFPNIIAPYKQDICYATTNRQKAICKVAKKSDLVLIIGSKISSNSTNLVKLSKKFNKSSYLINSLYEIENYWLKNVQTIAISAGASAPSILIEQVISYLKLFGVKKIIEYDYKVEKVFFDIPKKLKI